MDESDLGVLKEVKWQVPVFDAETTSWRRSEMEFLMAMRHLRLDSVLAGDKRRRSLSRTGRFHATALTHTKVIRE